MRAFVAPAVLAILVGCGGGGGSGGAGAGGGTTAATQAAATGPGATSSTGAGMTSSTGASTTASTGTGMGGQIPDPGTGDQVDQDFTDVEPNDTPQQATPLGVAMQGGVGVWVSGNNIGGSDTSDYFVFKNGPAAGPFSFDVCFGAPITGMTATLWKVVNGQEQMPPVGTWTAATGCVTDTSAPAMLEASAVYLFGLTATGGAGNYAA